MKTKSSPRSFGIFFGVLLSTYGTVGLFKTQNIQNAPNLEIAATLILGGTLLLVAWLKPSVLQVPNELWDRFGRLLKMFLSPIFMGLFFFVFFSPLAILLRLSGVRFLDLTFRDGRKSYWIPRARNQTTIQSLRNQF